MSNGIAFIENESVAWAFIHEGNYCVTFFGTDPIPDPLPPGYVAADSREDALTVYDAQNGTNLADRRTKREEVWNWYREQIAAGWYAQLRDEFDVVVYEPGFTLRIDDDARNEFDQLATKWTIAILSGLSPALVSTKIYGMDETSSSGNDAGHLVTVDVFLALIDAGGAYYQSLMDLREAYFQEIDAGNTSFTVGDPLPE
ncbi:hypothetical protein ACYFX5_09225 [Bremerella sp. T1]|uniref:hypothetical protein n=1 Tax=Bremerella sp. TYQ1 TaxID=3119568 RepID=UPI001CCC930E|nr:hypothetical protein [Bremerella volcania]UBM38434.1 hypothetical protein LA756_11160 [Bremerella volcania]